MIKTTWNEIDKRINWIKVIYAVLFIVSIAWFVAERGYEPFVGIIVAVLGIIDQWKHKNNKWLPIMGISHFHA